MPAASAMADACEAADEAPMGLRAHAAGIVAGDGDARLMADAFLASGDTAEALRLWFGPEAEGREPAELRRQIARDVTEIDQWLNQHLDAILHHPRFQRLEALWRATHWLIFSTERDAMARVRILSVRWEELADDFDRAPDIEQSELFHKLYSQEFGIAGGEPFGMLVCDHPVRLTAGGRDDVGTLRSLAQVGAAAFCPVVLGVDPAGLDLGEFADLDIRFELGGHYASQGMQRFRSLRASPDARFLALVMPDILARSAYSRHSLHGTGFLFEERCRGRSDLPWMGGAFALAHVVLRAFVEHRWIAAIRGTVDGEVAGGVVGQLPALRQGTDAPPLFALHPCNAAVGDARERELNAMGLIVLRPTYLSHHLAFYNLPTLYQPAQERRREGTRIDAMLHYLLCVCRFAHYVKVLARDWIGSYATADECERRLQRWISGYCTSNTRASFAEKAEYPLRSAQVRVTDEIGRPGSFACTVDVQPHFQIEQLATDFILRTTFDDVAR